MKEISKELQDFINIAKEVIDCDIELDFDDIIEDLRVQIEICESIYDSEMEMKNKELLDEVFEIVLDKNYKTENYRKYFR